MGNIPYITTLCLNGTLPCVDFTDVIMGNTPYITTLCLNGTLPCVDFTDVIMGNTPYITTLCLSVTLPCVDFTDVIMGNTPYITTLCLSVTLPCVDFMGVIMGDIPFEGVKLSRTPFPQGFNLGWEGGLLGMWARTRKSSHSSVFFSLILFHCKMNSDNVANGWWPYMDFKVETTEVSLFSAVVLGAYKAWRCTGGGVVGMTQLTSGEPGLFKPFGWCFKLIQSNDSYTMQSYIMD